MTKMISLALVALLFIGPAAAQETVDDAVSGADDVLEIIEDDDNDPPSDWLTSIAFGGSMNSGNSDTLGLTLIMDSEKETERHRYHAGAKGSYGETNDDTSTQTGKLFFNYKRKFGRLYLFSDNKLFHDKIALIAYRLTIAAGWGYKFYDNDRTTLDLELGAAYIREGYESPPAGEVKDELDVDDILALRVGEYFEHEFSETAKVWQTLEYQPEVSDFGNYLLEATAGVEAALNTTFGIRLSLENRYNAKPPYGSKKNDLATVAALAMQF